MSLKSYIRNNRGTFIAFLVIFFPFWFPLTLLAYLIFNLLWVFVLAILAVIIMLLLNSVFSFISGFIYLLNDGNASGFFYDIGLSLLFIGAGILLLVLAYFVFKGVLKINKKFYKKLDDEFKGLRIKVNEEGF